MRTLVVMMGRGMKRQIAAGETVCFHAYLHASDALVHIFAIPRLPLLIQKSVAVVARQLLL